uniref:Serotransferrin n=2 Tax=Bostrychus sinensis TaxID=86224 RepID=H2DG36_9TELE|nr:serum transferrin [Bostrychus sinensis]AEX63636.1 serum transferrin [Bostrychus sinensis]
MKPLHLVVLLCCLAFAAPSATSVKWCVISDLELRKCLDLVNRAPVFSCVKRESPLECIVAIKAGEADAITLNGEDIYTAGLRNYDLAPIIAEEYSVANADGCFYSVALAKKNTKFGLKDLKGKTSCHTGLGYSEGWNLPIGTLISKGVIDWKGADDKPLLQAVSEFFTASCVPGVTGYPNLCQLCKGDCSKSATNEYLGNAGAFKCLAEGAGQVAFLNPTAIPASESSNYEILCQDNTRTSFDNYKTCNLGRGPAHAVVTRKDKDLAEFIWTSLTTVRGFDLFSSANYGGKNLMFSDSTLRLQQVPPDTDSFLFLGAEFMSKIHSLVKELPQTLSTPAIKWCAVGHAEIAKCDLWNGNSYSPDTDTSAIECQSAPTVEECFKKIMRQEADAIAVDGGQVYTAGKCGLVPAMAEQYDEAKCSSAGVAASSYYAVAVILKDSGVTWDSLKGKRSCHTGIGRTAGWNIPMGLIHQQTNDCDFTKFFSSGCAPGADPASPFCRQCIGSGKAVGDESKCKASAEERYYGYAGAFRCLAEGNGDVAFIKHTIVAENTNGNGPDWAKSLRSEDFMLICPGKPPMPISDYESCHLAVVPAHAVMTRPEIRNEVVSTLQVQQAKFGPNGSDDQFRMFQSEGGKNLLFKDSTKCLQEVQADSYDKFLGPNYIASMESLRQCSATAPDLEKSCTFQTCQ